MRNEKRNLTEDYDKERLRSYAQVDCLNRISDKDFEKTSELVAGGDKSLLNEDINNAPIKSREQIYPHT